MIVIFLLNCLVVGVTVTVHYEFLYHAARFIPRMTIKPRLRIIFGVFAGLTAHAVEIWIFAFVYYFLHQQGAWGHLEGSFNGSLMDCVYFSFTTYSTVGYGDIQPLGGLRYLAGIEGLTGLVMITWTASFLYFEMQRLWNTG